MTAVVPTKAEGVFRDDASASQAVAELQRAGFPEKQINISHRAESVDPLPPLPSRATAEGLVLGIMIGIIFGIASVTILVGLIPRIIPLESSSLLFAVITGAAVGAFAGGMIGVVVGFFIRRQNPLSHAHEIHRILVTVQAGKRYNDAIRILHHHGALGSGRPLV